MSHTADKAEYIRNNGIYVSTPQGNSMWPFIRGMKDSIVLCPPKSSYRKYDVILYTRDDGAHVLHRVLKQKDGYCIVRGDNCYNKEHIENSAVMGVLVTVLKNGKKPVKNGGIRLVPVALWHFICPARQFFSRAKGAVTRRIRRKK